MGNPPFAGYSLQTKEQKADILSIYTDEKGKPYKTAGKIDYVSGWYFKTSELIRGTNIKAALVSTNSITQGEQVASVWQPLFDRFNIHIDFAHRTFRWDSEANLKAHVHCVIIGFSCTVNPEKFIFSNGRKQIAQNINPYLVDAPDVFIESRNKPICDVLKICAGGKPVEGGFLILTKEEKTDFLKKEPNAEKFIRQFISADDYINNTPRYCLWLQNVSPNELRQMPHVMERIEKVKEYRMSSTKPATRECANTPHLFMEIKQPLNDYMIIPATSSENRRYIPLGFVKSDTILNNAACYIDNATLYHFGILTSNVHMAWMRAVCGRLKSDYRYSNTIVYNNFPWCEPTDVQKEKIEKTAQGILDARDLYPDCSLADLYNELTMPSELRKAHQENDKAVMEAYGFKKKDENGKTKWFTEPETVACLMEMYKTLTQG